MAAESLDLSIIDSGPNSSAVVLGRNGPHMALGRIAFDGELSDLSSFRVLIEQAVRGFTQRPTASELERFGHRLFDLVFQQDLRELYDNLPPDHVRLNVISTRSELQKLPWEYIQEPKRPAGPQKERSIVRIVPTITKRLPLPVPFDETIRVLFVSAAPEDQDPVEFDAVKEAIKRTLEAGVPARFEIDPVESATRQDLFEKVTRNHYTILHFSGHGDVSPKGECRLIFVNRRTKKSDYVGAKELALLLAGRGIRLVILSACNTSAGDVKDDFAVMAEALVRANIPAVIANQLPVPTRSIAPFVSALYRTLLKTGDIDEAVGEGRVSLFWNLSQPHGASLEWGIPTLYRQYAANQLYQPSSQP